MPSMALGRGDVIVGVDTHNDEHVAVVIDGLGGRLGELMFRANPAGYALMVNDVRRFIVEVLEQGQRKYIESCADLGKRREAANSWQRAA